MASKAICKRMVACKTRLTILANKISKECEDKTHVHYLKERLNQTIETWQDYKDIHNQWVELCEEEEIEEQEIAKMDYEEKFLHSKTQLEARIENLQPTETSNADNLGTPTSSAEIKLPKTELPTFSGQLQEWMSFRELFASMIHENKKLSNVQKLQYLKGSLTGEAKELIRALPITNQSYDQAWDLLSRRYDNKRLLVFAFLKRLLNIPAVPKGKAKLLRGLVNAGLECITTLKILGQPTDAWDTINIAILLQKVDEKTRKEWNLSLRGSEVPTFDQFMAFLESRSQSLDEQEENGSTETKPQRKIALTHVAAIQESQTCPQCEEQHPIFRCEDFLKLSVPERIERVKTLSLCLNCLRSGHQVKQCKACSCKKCRKPHNTLLHIPTHETETLPVLLTNHKSQAILATAKVTVRDNRGKAQECRILLDPGSHVNIITEECVQRLGLRRRVSKTTLVGAGGTVLGKIRGEVKFEVTSLSNPNNQVEIEALIMHTITSDLPLTNINARVKTDTQQLILADPEFDQPSKIDILIGMGEFPAFLLSLPVSLSTPGIYAIETIFGWIITGKLKQFDHGQMDITYCNHVCVDMDERLRKFWEIEEIQDTLMLTKEEQRCEEHFAKTVSKSNNGRFIVRLPIKEEATPMGNSRTMAEKRFYQLEKRFWQNPQLKERYANEIQDYIQQGHMEACINDGKVNRRFYLPHHAIFKESSLTTKLRVVFDASAKDATNASLNSRLMTGPTIQNELFEILIRFRKYNVAFTADIEKMYRQVLVNEQDRDLQRILWRDDPASELQDYRLMTVTFGITSSPYLATKCLDTLANECEKTFPRGSKTLKGDFYVDDLISGAHTVAEATIIINELTTILSSAGFKLRKWASNNKEIMKAIPSETHEQASEHAFVLDEVIKTLGIAWKRNSDVFSFVTNSVAFDTITKRKVLSTVSQLFDPLGWVSPFTVRAKILMQRLWLKGVKWDDPLPSQLATACKEYFAEIKSIEEISITRCIYNDSANIHEQQIHGFCDASEQAYAAVIFIRSTHKNRGITCNLLCAKTRVAPVKKISLPRLELCAAHLLAKLVKKVKRTLNVTNVFAWSDSTITLSWLRGHPAKWKTFVANRVSYIQGEVPPNQWAHVATNENPADPASRGIRVHELKNNELWWHGPPWLLNEKLPKTNFQHDARADTEEKKIKMSFNVVTDHSLLSKFSSFNKLNRVIAQCRRFPFNSQNPDKKRTGPLTTVEIKETKIILLRMVQSEQFDNEIQQMRNNQALEGSSKIICLSPFIDEDGLIRVGGRLQETRSSYEQKHQILLPRDHPVVEALIRDEHLNMLHAGPQLTLAALRRRYWILGARDAVRRHVHRCVICFKHKAKMHTQIMGMLPETRVNPARPFFNCGVDYAGPINIKTSSKRKSQTTKAYICLFICFATKAIHLELVSDLTSEAFLADLRRFIARRGICSNIFSDCATNFVGANREIKAIMREIKTAERDERVAAFCSDREITWHFNPPGSPHFGGLWEAGVRSVKHHLHRILKLALLTYEEFHTVLVQIEACVNSRPLYPMSSDPSDFTVLTPAHFLIGDTLKSLPDRNLSEINEHRLSRWQRLQKIQQNFWKRWQTEYLPQLQSRVKWTKGQNNVKINDLALIKHENLPPTQWMLGRVVETHPGTDGRVRVVTLRTKSGVIKRCVNKICSLPISRND